MDTSEDRRWPSLLSVDQAAQLTGLNPQTVRTLIHDGRIRARSMGRAYVLARDELLVDIARHRHQVAADYVYRGEQRRQGAT